MLRPGSRVVVSQSVSSTMTISEMHLFTMDIKYKNNRQASSYEDDVPACVMNKCAHVHLHLCQGREQVPPLPPRLRISIGRYGWP